MFDEVWLMARWKLDVSPLIWESPLSNPSTPIHLILSVSSLFPISALGTLPLLSLEHHQDSVNLSCSSCGWFPRPSLLWKSTKEKGDTLSDPKPPIYSEQGNGLYCIYSWIILSSSVSNSITCSVTLSEDEKRNVSLDLGARLSGLLWKHCTYRYIVL